MLAVLILCGFVNVAVSDYTPSIDRPVEPAHVLKPTVFITLFIRNKAHILPYSLHYLEQQDYPKDRISLW